MSRSQSLRFRLGLLVTVLVVALTLPMALLLGVVSWQNQHEQLDDAVRLAAFQLAETGEAAIPAIDLEYGGDTFAVLFAADADVVARTGDVTDELLEALIDDVWQFTLDDGEAVSAEVAEFDALAAGAFCADDGVCDTAVVGAYRRSLGEHLTERWWWFLLAPIAVGGVALVLSRWLVARSLAPVDRMRAELDEITESDLARRVPVPDSHDELAALGRSLNATIGHLGDALAANERFVADAAHELRSPITGARAAIEIGLGADPDELVVDGLGELDRASRLIDDLLVLARRQGSQQRRAVVEVDVDDLARSAVAAARLRWPDVEITDRLQPVRIDTDPDHVRRIVTNLIENACRYGERRVVVAVTHADGVALIAVDDDGPGIAPEHRAEVFGRFVRLDESRARETGGSGLGLAIVAELVNDLGGEVSIVNGPMGGAAFEVRLPTTSPHRLGSVTR